MPNSFKRMFLGIGIFITVVVLIIGAQKFIPHRTQNSESLSTVERMLNEIPPATGTQSDRFISAAREHIRKRPQDAMGYVRFADGFLQKVRETGDPSLYSGAEVALKQAIGIDPDNVAALTAMGSLLLSRHQFHDALPWAERAVRLDPYNASAYGVLVDAYVELGDYDKALQMAQVMVDTRPDIRSYSRVSYIRELHGDHEGAVSLMKKAMNAAPPNSEQAKWCAVQLGNLYLNTGNIKAAEAVYRESIGDPPSAFATAGLARVKAAQRKYDEAIVLYEQALEVLPEHAFAEALVDVYQAAGKPAEAAKYSSLVREMLSIDEKNGTDINLEIAMFNTDHDQSIDEALQRAQHEYERRPKSIRAEDALSWALSKAGRFDEAYPYIQQALRLGTRDAAMLYHAGFIAYRLGRRNEAHEYLTKALAVNPYFSHRYAEDARNLLKEVRGQRDF